MSIPSVNQLKLNFIDPFYKVKMSFHEPSMMEYPKMPLINYVCMPCVCMCVWGGFEKSNNIIIITLHDCIILVSLIALSTGIIPFVCL